MKSLGELVKKWRLDSGLNSTEMAKLVGGKVKRQHIEQLEAAGNRQPRYIADLAKAMGTTVDALVALKMPPPLVRGIKMSITDDDTRPTPAPPAKPPKGFKSGPRMATQREVDLLDALEMLLPDDREATIRGIFERAEKQREHVLRMLPFLSDQPPKGKK